MSEAMIIRKGGGSGKLSPNTAILRVVTSTGCSVTVSNSSAGYSKTHADSDGFAWSSDANVKDHFFEIPSGAFGTITVTATNTYGTNTKTLTVNTAGKVYEQLCGGLNIILDSTFGLQDGYDDAIVYQYAQYDERNKIISITNRPNPGTVLFNYDAISITPYSKITISAKGFESGSTGNIYLFDKDGIKLSLQSFASSGETKTGDISNKYYDTAGLQISVIRSISEIVLS